MSHRGEQTGAAIRKAVQQIIAKGLQDPRVSGLITVTGVNVTGDFAQAVISVSVLPEDREELVLHGLTAGSNYIRREVGDMIRTKKLPQFIFKIDRSLKKQAAVLREINRAVEERAPTDQPPPTSEEQGS